MDKFEQWFINQDFYTNMRFIHGDALFIKDGDVYRVLPVQMTWVAWQSRQAEVDELRENDRICGKLIDRDTKALDELFKANDGLRGRIEELEKQIVNTLEMAKAWKESNTDGVMSPSMRHIMLACASEVEEALRGDNA